MKRLLMALVVLALVGVAVVAFRTTDWAKVPSSANAMAAFAMCADQQAQSTVFYHPRLDAAGNFIGYNFYAKGLSCDTEA